MRIAHILRKYNPAEWGGMETAVQRLLDGLRALNADALVYCPRNGNHGVPDPLAQAGHRIERFRAFIPVAGITKAQRQQLFALGGNLMSLDLIWKLRRAPGLAVIHTHTLNRLGGIAATVARFRKLPLVATIHGGVLDLPEAVKEKLLEPLRGGVEWGKVFGWLLRSRQVLDRTDAILTCNRREATLLKEKYPDKIIVAQPHGIPAGLYLQDHRDAARAAFPSLGQSTILLAAGRIDPVKNQLFLVRQLARARQEHGGVQLVLAGACTDEAYGKLLKKEIRNLGLEECVTLTGGLPPADPRLIGLMQLATVLAVPSLSETFGLVILESWAAGTPVISSRTSGAVDLVREGENGWLFDINEPESFHRCLSEVLRDSARARALTDAGQRRVRQEFDSVQLAKQVKHLYQELI